MPDSVATFTAALAQKEEFMAGLIYYLDLKF